MKKSLGLHVITPMPPSIPTIRVMHLETDSPAYLEGCARLGKAIARWLPVDKLKALGDLAVDLERYPLFRQPTPIWSA